jgi:catechol 2,3-dioxygenase-like lactoylglutathione lyase family enzyme
MESLISRLLNDFENGRMTRRQLVQSLAMAAVAAPFASAAGLTNRSGIADAGAASLAAVPYKTVWLDHISFGCTDYKRTADFYTDLMGWAPVAGSDNGKQVVLNVGDIGQIIVRNSMRSGRGATPVGAAGTSAAPAAEATPNGRGGPRPPVNAVIDHIAFGVQPWDTEAVRGELLKRGLTPREDTGSKEPMTTSKYKSFHVKDPDGWDLQISNATKEHHDLP